MRFFRQRKIGHDAKKCTKSYNARAQLLFCSLNLLFSDFPVAVAVVDFLKFLMITAQKHGNMESIFLFVKTKLTTTDKVFFIIKSFNITRKPAFAHFGEHEKEPCKRNLLSIQNGAISLATMHSNEL